MISSNIVVAKFVILKRKLEYKRFSHYLTSSQKKMMKWKLENKIFVQIEPHASNNPNTTIWQIMWKEHDMFLFK